MGGITQFILHNRRIVSFLDGFVTNTIPHIVERLNEWGVFLVGDIWIDHLRHLVIISDTIIEDAVHILDTIAQSCR